MNKLLILVGALASMSFSEVISINLNVTDQGWNHDSAALVRVNLGSQIKEGEIINSAVLKFTGVQNFKEPEVNDSLHVSLLNLKNYKGSGLVNTKYYYDDEAVSNYFNSNKKDFLWVNNESHVGTYTDKNDLNASYTLEWKPDGWENSTPTPGHDWRYEGYYKPSWEYKNGESKPSDWNQWANYNNNVGWNYTNKVSKYGVNSGYGKGALWSKISGFTKENFDMVLDVNSLEDLMNDDGWIGVGIDADCHYTGSVQLVVTTTTQNVPEPASLSLMLLGLTSLAGAFFIRKRK